MNLAAMRTEALNHGFDPIVYGARIDQYINDALADIARRADYYQDDATYDFSTVNGTVLYPFPSSFGRIRSVHDTGRQVELQYASIRQFDRSSIASGPPMYYAIFGAGVNLYPTPDGIYTLEMRYWRMPPVLVNDTDIPTIPVDYHNMLWFYAVGQCYEADDDVQMGDYWNKKWEKELSLFAADQKFPTTDGPTQARGMWDSDDRLNPGRAWTTNW